MPSHPLARNARVGLPIFSKSAITENNCSLSPLSLLPQVRNTRLWIAVTSPLRASRSGRIARSYISYNSYGTPGTAYITFSPIGQISPGAVPRRCAIGIAPRGTIAWRMLISGMRRLRDANISEIAMPISSSKSSSTPITSAIASRVMSS